MVSEPLQAIRRRFLSSAWFLVFVLIAATGYWISPIGAFGQGEHSKSSTTNPSPDPCALLTSSEIEKMQGESVTEKTFSQQAAGSFSLRACFYRTSTFAESISLALAVPNPANKDQAGPRKYWIEHFHDADTSSDGQLTDERRSEARKNEAEGEIKPVKISGLGEQAYWIANAHVGTLYVLQENYFLRISLGGKDRDDVRSDKAKDLARIALRRLKSTRAAT